MPLGLLSSSQYVMIPPYLNGCLLGQMTRQVQAIDYARRSFVRYSSWTARWGERGHGLEVCRKAGMQLVCHHPPPPHLGFPLPLV